MKVVLSKEAAKYLDRLDAPTKKRVRAGLVKLEAEPPKGDIKKMQGADYHRLRIGGYRVLFEVVKGRIAVHKIAPRGQAYGGE